VQRIPEVDLMDDPAQARAYAEADFSEPHNHFIDLLHERLGKSLTGTVLDLGCGPGDICIRFAHAFPDCLIHGMDGANAMLDLGRQSIKEAKLGNRIKLIQGYLPDAKPPLERYDIIISNSLLHHLKNPATLWKTINTYATPNASVFVMDLLRPEHQASAQALVDNYASEEPEILRKDFFNSLCAAYTADEARQQLIKTHLGHLNFEIVSDRHWIISGKLTA
jgi:cyclopropane fatty-acyl-phospholipid synthase-like methyltransferase